MSKEHKEKPDANLNRNNSDTPVIPTGESLESAPVRSEPSYTNSYTLVWPTDRWGFTSEVRKALTNAASKINGHEDKKALFDATLEVGLKHIEAKYAEKQPERDVRKAQTSVD